MDHDRSLFLAVGVDIFECEALREVHIELNCRELPFASNDIRKDKIKLWSVKSCLPDAGFLAPAAVFNQFLECFFGAVPYCRIADIIFFLVEASDLNSH